MVSDTVLGHLSCGHLLFPGDVPTVLTDGWEDRPGDPILELADCRVGGLERHQRLVETAFGDQHNAGRLLPSDMIGSFNPVESGLVIRKMTSHLRDVGLLHAAAEIEANGEAHVTSDEPWLTVDLDDADGVGVEGEVCWEGVHLVILEAITQTDLRCTLRGSERSAETLRMPQIDPNTSGIELPHG